MAEPSTESRNEKFSSNPLYRAALAMASRYNKLVDTGDDDDTEEMVPQEAESPSDKMRNNSKYNKLPSEGKPEKAPRPKKGKVACSQAMKDSKKVTEEVKAKGGMDVGSVQRSLPKNTHVTPSGQVIMPRKRRESSSSHADEDTISEQKGTEFHYRELDDEYGSRPSVHPTRKDHDVISMISTSSQEYDPTPKHLPIPAPRRSVSEIEVENTPPEKPDPIIGHEHGVRPLLDDDELEDAYGGVAQKVPEQPLEEENMSSPQTSVPTSPLPGDEGTDIFGAAPFRKKTVRRKRPSSRVENSTNITATTTTSIDTKPADQPLLQAKERPPVLPKPRVAPKPGQYREDFPRPPPNNRARNKRHNSGGGMKQGLLAHSDDSDSGENVNDVFGSAPFMKRSSSSTDAVLKSASPYGDNKTNISDNRNGVTNSFSADSLNFRTENFQDNFGAVPFESLHSKSSSYVHKSYDVKNSTNNQNLTFQSASATIHEKIVIQPDTRTDYTDSKSSNILTPNMKKESSKSRESTMPSPNYRKFKDEIDSDEELVVVDKANKPSRSPRPAERDIESSAFSNMSFNDEFDDEENQPPGIAMSASLQEASLRANLAVSEEGSGFTKEPSPVNADSAKPGGYDTFTWPRKRHKMPSKPQATAEPFTVKKKVDSIFK